MIRPTLTAQVADVLGVRVPEVDGKRLREHLIAQGLLRPSNGVLRRVQLPPGEPVLRIDKEPRK